VNDSSPSGSVAADFKYNFNIQNSIGTLVFSSAPTAVNRSLSLTTIGNISDPSAGSLSITSGVLSSGTYTATFSGSSHVFLNAVPEPSSYILLGSGGGILGFAFLRRRQPR
jgi:hypothetical protein